MAINKVALNTSVGEKVIIDLTVLTVTPETLAEGVIAMNAAGELIVGTHKCASVPVLPENALIDADGNTFLTADGNYFVVKEDE